jgi:hypothetical protein
MSLVDAHSQPALARQLLECPKVVGKPAVDCGPHRSDAPRDQQVLRLQDAVDPALECRLRLDVRHHAHRGFEEQAVRNSIEVAADAAAVRVWRVRRDRGSSERS